MSTSALSTIEPERVTYQRGACDCGRCRANCLYIPGWFAPQEIEPLAQAMGLSVEELFAQHLQVDWAQRAPPSQGKVFGLSPRLKGNPGGHMAPADPRGRCHWFGSQGLCKVHTLGKPAECAAVHCSQRMIFTHHDCVRLWDSPAAQEFVARLLGRAPIGETGPVGIRVPAFASECRPQTFGERLI